MWEHFHHQADIGVRGFGESLNEAFEQAAIGLMAVICEPKKVAEVDQVQIVCEGNDIELLFADWLNSIIYEIATRRMLFGRFEVHIDEGRLTGKGWGEKIDANKHDLTVEVKGATYTQLKVRCNENGKYIAQCVVDV